MSSSLPATARLPQPAPDLPSGLRLPAALAIALVLEAGLIAVTLGRRADPPVPPAPAPVKIARLVTIADVPGEPDPAPPTPMQSAPKPKPTPPKAKPAPAPKPVANAPSAAPVPTPTTDAKPVEAPAAAPAPSPSPVQRDKAPEKPSGVRRGLVPLVRVEPDYPPRALASNTEGVVVARATIEADGSVSAVKIVSAQPPKLFDQEAIRALMRWKFSPNEGGMVGEIELRFRLSN
ncbi:energy transducer TonB [uncultured Ralstonia sp.]|jgi:protein TonB|uniref:energy transducer TonB n=1 Tax=Ralstonia sp. TaxID=54061 RepID=UPI001EACC4F5|nr:energy transducer TonB [uncultured Ralstonia sp.]UCF22409.1 MAG: TonB family protein [Ralstonia sp.]